MSSIIPSLWPPDLAPTVERTPLAILKEQASQLGAATKNLLEGQVVTQVFGQGNDRRLRHWFNIVAPSLDRYTYQLFVVSHKLELYPLDVNLVSGRGITTLNSETEFIAYLRQVFASDETRRVIGALLAQVQS